MDHVILVDADDHEVGTMEKIAAHRAGLLHRAFSIFIFHPDGRLMLQQRAWGKYHSAGLWTNTCCSHPRPGERVIEAARRRLVEEMGFDTDLKPWGTLMYKVEFDNGLTEHEYDHLLVGEWAADPHINPDEAAGWRWADPHQLQRELAEEPERYTYWLQLALPQVMVKRS